MQSIEDEEDYPVALRQTLLTQIEGSIDSNQYLRLYIEVRSNGSVTYQDVIGNGRFACAYYVSSLLHLMNLLRGAVHTTVDRTELDLIASGWRKTSSTEPGAVIIWGPKLASDGHLHRHIGFYLGDDWAVSTDGTTGLPTKHHVTYGTRDGDTIREIQAIYIHERLED